jgi:single-strand DNA-binding protein
MASFNKITIVGYLGRDPQIRYTPQGTAVCDFSIATSERRGGGADAQDITTWFKITVWGKQAETANQYLAKGRQVYIEGRLRQEEYTDREGLKRTSLTVNASDVQFLTPKGNDEGGSNYAPRQSGGGSSAPAQQPENDSHDGPSDEDIPF